MSYDPLSTGRTPHLEYLEDLLRSVRVYLGLLWVLKRSGWWHSREPWHFSWMASAADVSEGEMRKIAAQVRRSENPVIRRALQYGLPLSGLTELSHGEHFTCPDCGFRRYQVPCRQCALPWPDELRPDLENEEDVPLVRPRKATDAEPGSRKKIKIMRQRLARGESCFHKDDRRREVGYTGVFPDIVSVFAQDRDWDSEE